MALGSTQPLTEMSTVVMNSGNHNFLEPSGPVQACNGTALPLLNKTLQRVHSRPVFVLMLKVAAIN